MIRIDVRRADGHRAVEKHAPRAEPVLFVVPGHPVQQQLAAAHRECGDQDIPPRVTRLGGDVEHLLRRLFPGPVISIAVGRFHQHEIGVVNIGRVAHDRRALVAEVAAEDELAFLAAFGQPQLDDAGAEDVAGVPEPEDDGRQDPHLAVIRQRPELAHAGDRLVGRVQRRDRRQALALPAAVLALRVVLLDEAGVLEHDVAQGARRRVRKHLAGEPALDQQRDATGMVDVRVAQHDRVDARRVERERLAVQGLLLATALDQAAVEQEAEVTGLDQVTRAGHTAGCAERLQPHRFRPTRRARPPRAAA